MKIALCDDEQIQQEKYRKLLQGFADKHGIQAQFTGYAGGEQLLFHMEELTELADIIFLDVNMPGKNGMETAAVLHQTGYSGEIVFLTVSEAQVFQAFDVDAFHYILKDKTPVEKVERIFLSAVAAAEEKYTKYLRLSSVGEYRNIPVRKIEYFEVFQRLITVYYEKGQSFEFVSTMGKLEAELYGQGFVRISRSHLVSVDHIFSVSHESVTMTGGKALPVGRKYFNGIKDAMERQSEK